ncbi:holo-ACP synthase [Aquisalimonas asiatica]|uniref:Holo-[acyl-carrier-protein] synthase n=1 Tax=Aquisalimonas asiatica TaxID=406100 RepID=A0A1H8QD38_9GAMM|nr:holo-ACP synthase [Aquisalimonas asiatica]SEO51966.1 holo-[acyl-carrier protein] synthase [Aquisalimonas asiatica]
MSIIGIGTDLVDVARVRRVLSRHGERFAGRVLVGAELERWRHHGDPGSFLARRWAVKEAAAKAMGTGIGGALGFHDLQVGTTRAGAPTLQVTGQGAATARALGIGSWHVSITDEGAYALAFVIAEAGSGQR